MLANEIAKNIAFTANQTGDQKTSFLDRIDKAEPDALSKFKNDYKSYSDVKKIPAIISITKIEEYSSTYIKCYSDSILFFLKSGYEISFSDTSYIGEYLISGLDIDNGTFLLHAPFLGDTIANVSSLEHDKYERCLAWYILKDTSFTAQELIAGTFFIQNQGIGDSQIEYSPQSVLKDWRKQCLVEANKVLRKPSTFNAEFC